MSVLIGLCMFKCLNMERDHFFNFVGAPMIQRCFLAVNASLCWLNNVSGVQLVHFFGSAGFGTFLQVSALASHCANFTPKPEENDQYSANYSECNTSSKTFHYYQ